MNRRLKFIGCALLLSGIPAVASAQATMRAVIASEQGASLQTVARPVAAAGQVLVKIRASGVNPIDWKSATNSYRSGPTPSGAPAPSGPRISGNEASGVIESLGSGVTGWKPGDAVFFGAISIGSYAEYAAIPVELLAAKPEQLSFAEAAGIPTAATTAWNSIIDLADIKAGQKILIHGAAGGTGSAAVQIVKARGAYVIGTASPRNHAYLRSIGVDEVIDYNTEKFEERVKDVDVVYNTVDAATANRSIAVVRRGGTLLSIAGQANAEQCQAAGITCGARKYSGQTPAAEVLRQVAQLAVAGKYRVNVDRSYALADFQQAWDYGKQGHTRGKLVLTN